MLAVRALIGQLINGGIWYVLPCVIHYAGRFRRHGNGNRPAEWITNRRRSLYSRHLGSAGSLTL
jgi:hypothetical protein